MSSSDHPTFIQINIINVIPTFSFHQTSSQTQKMLEKLPFSHHFPIVFHHFSQFFIIFSCFPHVFPTFSPRFSPGSRPAAGLQEIDLTEEYACRDGQGNWAKCRAAAGWKRNGRRLEQLLTFIVYWLVGTGCHEFGIFP